MYKNCFPKNSLSPLCGYDKEQCKDPCRLSNLQQNLSCIGNSRAISTSAITTSLIPGSGTLDEFPTLLPVPPVVPLASLCPRADSGTVVICIRSCEDLGSVAGLDFVNGDIVIADPLPTPTGGITPTSIGGPELLDIFPNLLIVNGSIRIISTSYLRITGFSRLRLVTGTIDIINNPFLSVIPTFSALLNIGGQILPPVPLIPQIVIPDADDLDPRCGNSSLRIANNTALRHVAGFNCLKQVKDSIIIDSNNCLESIVGFKSLYRVKELAIANNPVLRQIVAFINIDQITNGFYLLDNNLDGRRDFVITAFDELTAVGDFVVIGNKNITLIYNRIITATGSVVINSNTETKEISLPYLRDVGGKFSIESNTQLEILKVDKLRTVAGDYRVNNNAALTKFYSPSQLQSIGGGLMIADNKSIIDLCGFECLKYIGSKCISNPGPIATTCCNCLAGIILNWLSVVTRVDCTVTINVPTDLYTDSVNACAYQLPELFFRQLCNTNARCGDLVEPDEPIIQFLIFSVIIFRNQKLKGIKGFERVRELNANLYVVGNYNLHTVRIFDTLAFAVDIYFRNNSSLHFIFGFNKLIAIRDLVILETLDLVKFDGLRCLEFAQTIALEAAALSNVVINGPIPSVVGYITTSNS